MSEKKTTESKKTAGQLLQAEIGFKPKNLGEIMSDAELEKVQEFCEGYKTFLTQCKTERETVDYTIDMITKKGYKPFVAGEKYKAGDKVYFNNRGKSLIITTFGKKPLSEGVHITASHIDCPRLDLKSRPLYEESEMAFLKTHYYGGIKKYQWLALPLSLHGVVYKADGSSVTVRIGDEHTDPVFCITDLLPHLAQNQMSKTLSAGVTGEQLNILVGCMPFKDDAASEKIKLNIANILFEKYGIVEKDFLSAELSAVPAFDARDIGFDRSLIGSYGHDDRVCAYTSLIAEIEAEAPEHTTVTLFADKEETGSNGNTGTESMFLVHYLEDLADTQDVKIRHVLAKSKCLSADVGAAYDPAFAEAYEKRNSAFINYGTILTKYTGSRGKSGTNDASAETVAFFRKFLDDAGVIWQTGELGKVDQGGGGTVAKFISFHNIDTIDLGVPVLSMHAPLEVVSKGDVYMTYKAIAAFYAV